MNPGTEVALINLGFNILQMLAKSKNGEELTPEEKALAFRLVTWQEVEDRIKAEMNK